MITLPDGSEAIVRTSKRGWRPTAADLAAVQEVADLVRNLPRCPGCKRANTIVEGACEICGWEQES